MKRVFTDERYPGIEIVNHGSGTFEVWIDGKLETTFESWENQDGSVSDAFAQRRANDYFERLGKRDLTGEFERQWMDAHDHTDIFNAPDRKPNSSEIDTLMAQERVETDPQKKADLRQHLLNLMKQEESLAESVVNHLLGL